MVIITYRFRNCILNLIHASGWRRSGSASSSDQLIQNSLIFPPLSTVVNCLAIYGTFSQLASRLQLELHFHIRYTSILIYMPSNRWRHRHPCSVRRSSMCITAPAQLRAMLTVWSRVVCCVSDCDSNFCDQVHSQCFELHFMWHVNLEKATVQLYWIVWR
jgi:hypothetical protein